jgi:hypothetical protein
MTTDVSSTPRSTRWSGTRFDVLIGDDIEVSSELFAVDGWSRLEELCDGFCCDEAKTSQRGEFTDGYAVARHDEGLALVETTHDLPAAVAELSLGDDLAHPHIVARCATPARTMVIEVHGATGRRAEPSGPGTDLHDVTRRSWR